MSAWQVAKQFASQEYDAEGDHCFDQRGRHINKTECRRGERDRIGKGKGRSPTLRLFRGEGNPRTELAPRVCRGHASRATMPKSNGGSR